MQPSIREAELVGYVLGDGSICPAISGQLKVQVVVYGNDDGDLEFIQPIRDELGWKGKISRNGEKCWAFGVPRKYLLRLKQLGLLMPMPEEKKELPEGWESWGFGERGALLSGLWQSDGGTEEKKGYNGAHVRFYTTSKNLDFQVGELIKGLGMESVQNKPILLPSGKWKYVRDIRANSFNRFKSIVRMCGEKAERLIGVGSRTEQREEVNNQVISTGC